MLTGPQVARARQVAADAGMTVEARDHHQTRLAATRSGATAAGLLLALGILARTVGLIRGEAAGDLRTLTATGATGGVLALLGAAGATWPCWPATTTSWAPSAGSRSRTSPSPSSPSR